MIWKSRFKARTDCFNIDLTKYDEVASDPKEKVRKHQFMNMDNQEKWIPLDDNHIKAHIGGTAPVALFTKNMQDQIHFGVIDFDFPWDYQDVVEVQRLVMTKYEVPCYLAASSRKGWHLLFFWNDWIDMRLFVSFWDHIYVESGMAGWVKEGKATSDGKFYKPPEIFPSRLSYGDNQITSLTCKAIKPPMVEPRMKFGYNCFYKELEGSPQAVVDQWAYLDATVQMPIEYFDGVIKKHEIPLVDPSARRIGRQALLDPNGVEISATEIKPKGKLEKIFKNCSAAKAALDSTAPTHDQRLMLGILSLHTEGGQEKFLELVKGKPAIWSQDITKKELLYLAEKRYCPLTCKSMQEKGICQKGVHPTEGAAKDHCLEPREINGELIPPSPYRFALKNSKKDEATYAKLSRPIQDACELVTACAQRNLKKGNADYDRAFIDYRTSVVDAYSRMEDMRASEKGQMLSFLEAGLPYITKAELKVIAKEAREKRKELQTKDLQSDRTVLHFFRSSYKISNGKYVRVKIDAKGNEVSEDISECVVHIDSDVTEVKNLEAVSNEKDLNESCHNRYISGSVVTTKNKVYTFKKFPTAELYDSKLAAFKKHISLTAGTDFGIFPGEEPYVMRCIHEFNSISSQANDDVTKKKILVREVGWNGGCYLVDNMIINSSGIHSTKISYPVGKDSYMVEVDPRDWARRMPSADYGKSGVPEFHPAVISKDESEMKDLLLHFINNFLPWHRSPITYVGAGFAWAAALQDLLDPSLHHFSPTLFYVGLTGKGKTEVVKALQKFYGPWNNVPKFEGSTKSKLDLPAYFNDMAVVIDDYKKNFMKSKELSRLIHSVYDRGVRSRLDRNSEAKDVDPSKGFLIVGGEDIFENESSAAARSLIVDFPTFSLNEENEDNFHQVLKYKDKYSAITAALIAKCIHKNKDKGDLRGQLQAWFDEGLKLFEASDEYVKDNADRVVKNISLVYMAFRAFTQMCYEQYKVIDVQKLDELNNELRNACNIVCMNTFKKIKEDKAGVSFISEISDLLQAQGEKYYISGNGVERTASAMGICIGWRDHLEKGWINLFPKVILAALRDKYKGDKDFQSTKTIGNALLEDGHVAKFQDSEKPFRRVTNPYTRIRMEVLTIKAESIYDESQPTLTTPYDPPSFESYSNVKHIRNYAPGAERDQ